MHAALARLALVLMLGGACGAPLGSRDGLSARRGSCVRSVRAGDFVRCQFNGTDARGQLLSSSYDRNHTLNVFVGVGELVPELDQVLLGMCVNEKRHISIPSSPTIKTQGYGIPLSLGSIVKLELLVTDVWNLVDAVQVQTLYRPHQCNRTVQVSDYVRYHYNGSLLDGSLFDTSSWQNKTYNSYVGTGWLIPGVDNGIRGMCVGEQRHIIVPPFFAYGEHGADAAVPPNATLVFDILLLDLHNPHDRVAVQSYHVPHTCNRRTVAGDFVRYHYNGSLLDGTNFDSSYLKDKTYDTYLGKGYIIAGMEEGLLGVCMGEHRRLTIPPHLAYGEAGIVNKIPGSAAIVVHVLMVDFHNPTDNVNIETQHLPEECSHHVHKGDFVGMHYNTSLLDGTKLYSSRTTGWTYEAIVGTGQLIPGLDQGLMGMCLGERRQLIIPPHLGFGEKGIEGEVPGSAVLRFEVELVQLEEGLPDGYIFVWKDNAPDELFTQMDEDHNENITLTEFSTFIKSQVSRGLGRLLPGRDHDHLIGDMFRNQDRNGDGIITASELKLKQQEDEERQHDELTHKICQQPSSGETTKIKTLCSPSLFHSSLPSRIFPYPKP
uniref:peptidyl-prolyl cis-trans isomerase FKBP9-like isoform X2 n=2 Tax=Myxine glutinosa TaxID=7769 RepID=UPI00358FBCA2